MVAWTDRILIKAINIAVFVFFLSSNVYSITGPAAHEKISYITPAAFGLYVWTLTNLLLLGTLIYQFTDDGFSPIVEGIGFRFAIIGLLNGAWGFFYHHGHYVIAFILVCLLSIAISTVYFDMKTRFPPKTTGQAVFVSLPFSLWHAYSVFLVILTGFVAFSKDKHTQAPTVATKVFAIIALVSLTFISVGYAFHSNKGDIAGAAVISFELLAIYINQPHPKMIHYVALAGFIISLLAILKAAFYTARNPSLTADDERAPLIAGSN